MNKTTRIIIVVAVMAAAALAFVVKQNKPAPPVARTGSINEATTALPADATATGPATATAKLPRLVDLGASSCIPCKMMKPILDDLKANYADRFTTEFIDVWEDREAGKQYNIEMIPTQIFYDAEGKERFRHTGFFGKEDILAKWRELGVTLAEAGGSENKQTNERTQP
jgi:thioredoxin 1